MEFDTPLADYCPDIARLIRVDCTPFAEKWVTEGDKAVVSGKAVYDLLYETDYKNKLKYCSFTQDFSCTTPIPRNFKGDVSVFGEVRCKRINCKLLSPRRIIIRCTLDADFGLETDTMLKAVAVNEDGESFFQKKSIDFLGRAQAVCETFRINDTVTLSQAEKNIGEIVCGRVVLQEPQIVPTAGNAEIKTTASIFVLCEEEAVEGKYFCVTKSLPVTLNMHSDSIEDFKTVSADISPRNPSFTADLDQYGESRVIKTDFEIFARALIKEPKSYTVATDLFEKSFDGVCVNATGDIPKNMPLPANGFSIEAKLTELSPRPASILQWDILPSTAVAEPWVDGIKIKGTFNLSVLADTAEGVYSFDQAVPFEQDIELNSPAAEYSLQAQVFPIEVMPNLHSDGSITARIIASAKINLCYKEEECFVADVAKRTPAPEALSEPTLIYRFPQKGETLWDIAKSYKADPESILNSNLDSFDENGTLCLAAKPVIIKL